MESLKQKFHFRFSTSSFLSSRSDLSEEEEPTTTNKLSTPLFSTLEDVENRIPKNIQIAFNVYDHSLLHFTEEEFKYCVGINRSTFNYLNKFLNKNQFSTQLKQMNTEKALLITIWYLRNLEVLEQLSLRFNLNTSIVRRVLNETTQFFAKNVNQIVKWPGKEDVCIIKSDFAKQLKTTGIIGAIGAYRLKINGHKNKTHLLIQGICDNKHKFTDITCGEIGNSHVAQVLKKSAIYHKGENGFFENDFLIGTKDYPCLTWLVSPYKHDFTERHKEFNEKHISAAFVIRDAFRMVTNRFCRLGHFYSENNVFIKNCVATACVTHNVCIDLNDEFKEEDCFSIEEETGVDHIEVFSPEIFSKRNEVFREMFTRNKYENLKV